MLTDLRSLFVHQLCELLHAEHHAMQALPRWASFARSERLRSTLAAHGEQTRGHADRIECILRRLGEATQPVRCAGMVALADECDALVHRTDPAESMLVNTALASSVRRVKLYEVAAYEMLRAQARALDHADAFDRLSLSLDEERIAERTLAEIADSHLHRLITDGATPADRREPHRGAPGPSTPE